MTTEVKAKEYAKKMWGVYIDSTYEESNGLLTYGNVSEKDYKRGALEAEFSFIEDLLKSGHLKEGVYKEYFDRLEKITSLMN